MYGSIHIGSPVECMGPGFGRRLEMTKTFADTLNRLNADPDSIQQGLRLFLAEQSDDLTPDEMLKEMRTSADPVELDALLQRVRSDPEALSDAVLFAFDSAWTKAADRPAVEAAIEHAKTRLPVIELGILAVVAMYGMYRLLPAQPIKVVKRTVFDPKKGYIEEETVDHEPFIPIVSAVMTLFSKKSPPD
jgi:hypothetical protein